MTSPGREFELADAAAQATATGRYAAAELRAGELVAGRFRIEELLGIGGMGVVYRAHDEQLQVAVALKLLRPELASRADAFARFRQELLLARQVSSPHVVRIHDLVQHDGRWLISMDYVAGQSLERYLDTHPPLAPEAAVEITRQLALGLAAAHQRGVIHRDLKPANVLLDADHRAYVSDFGVARSAGASGITGSGVVVGTPEYLSPEQARAEPVDQRSDLYALGLILYEMLTGKLPFPGGTPAETLAQRIVRSPRPVTRERPDLPGWLAAVCTRLLQLKPARRFQRAEELVAALDRRRVPWQWPEPRRILGFALALIALAAVVTGAWFIRASAPPALPAAEFALLPLAPGEEQSAALAAALSELLGRHLARNAAGVDGIRVAHVLRQLGYDQAAAERHPARVAEALAAKRLVAGTIDRDGERLRLELRVLDPREEKSAPASAVGGWVTIDALPLATEQLMAQFGIVPRGSASPNMPVKLTTLEAFGRGLIAARRGDPKAAAAAWAECNRDEPRFNLAWRQRIDALQVIEPDQAIAVAHEAVTALERDSSSEAQLVRAWSALLDGDARRAATLLQPVVGAAPDDASARLLFARAQTEAGDYAAARATLEPLVASDSQNGAAWLLLGRGAIRAGEAQRGVDEYLVRAQVAFTRLGDARGQADTLNGLGVGYERLGLIEAAAQHFSDAAQLRERLGDARGAAQSLRNLSSVRAVTGDYAAGEVALDHARKLLETQGDQGALADLDNAVGVLQEERGDFAKALAAYRSALGLRQQLGDHALIAESLINVGFCYYQSGEFDDAGVYWRQAQDEAAKAEDLPGKVRAAQSLSLWQVARGDWPAARKLLDDSLASAEEQQMLEETAVSLAGLAELDRLEGRVTDALAHTARAADLFRQRQDQRGIAEMALLQSAVYLGLGAWPEAEQALAPLAKSAPSNREQRALLALRQGELALGRGDRAQAQRSAASALAEATAVHSEAVAMPARLLAAEAESGAGDAAAARSALQAAEQSSTHYRPLPLQLELEAAALAVLPPPAAAARYRHARELLAPLPGYWRAHELYQRGAQALKASGDADGAAAAARLAQTALDRLNAQTPATLRPRLAAAFGPSHEGKP